MINDKFFLFYDFEIDFLKNVDAIDLADFAKQTAGYWD